MTVVCCHVFFVALNALQLTRIIRERLGTNDIARRDQLETVSDAA